MSNQTQGIERVVRAFGYSMKGLAAAWRHEAAFRQETVLCLALLPASFWVGTSVPERLLLIATLFIVLITELFNSAIEALTDRVGAEHHELSGRAKDISSAAVFLALVLLAAVWVPLAWQRFA